MRGKAVQKGINDSQHGQCGGIDIGHSGANAVTVEIAHQVGDQDWLTHLDASLKKKEELLVSGFS